MNRPIIHQQIEYLIKKINDLHEAMKQRQPSIPQAEMDMMMQNLRQLYEAALLLYQNNTFAALVELEEKFTPVQQQPEPVLPPKGIEVAEQTVVGNQKVKKTAVNINASLFENVPTLGGKFGSEETLHKKIAGKPSSETVAHKIHRNPIKDLKAAIGINEKFLFINKLFGGNNQQYNEAIERINSSANLSSAKEIVEGELFSKYDWHADSGPVKEFMELVERRFITE